MGQGDATGTSARFAEAPGKTHVEPTSLIEEQAALRRVATLVARGASSTEVFEAVAQEVAQVMRLPNTAVCRYDDDGTVLTVLAVWGDRPTSFGPGSRWPLDGPSMSAEVLRTGRPVRVEGYAGLPGSLAAEAREHGFDRVAGAPIVVDGRVWGVIATSSPDAPLAERLEDRLAEFTELVATAVVNAEGREELARLAEEQAALRRVATLVAESRAPADLLAVVAEEVARIMEVWGVSIARYELDGTATELANFSEQGELFPVGTRWSLDGRNVLAGVRASGRAARIDDHSELEGMIAESVRPLGIRSTVGIPIVVAGRVWGAIVISSTELEPLPEGTEAHLAEFTELVATAIANSQAHEELTRLADEQAALRRVATLVARGGPPAEVFESVIAEVGRLATADASALSRFEGDGTLTIIGGWSKTGGYLAVGERHPLGEGTLGRLVFETGGPGRIDNYQHASGSLAAAVRDDMGWRSAVGAPIIVEGRLWGVIGVGSTTRRPLPDGTEARLAEFTELVGTAIANAEGRRELEVSRARIVATADATRRRIERDLHDGAQQRLVSLALQLRAVHDAPPAELPELRAALAQTLGGLTSVLDDLREIARGIHPATLAEGGLGPALRTLARRSAVPVELDLRAERGLPERVEVAAYYVVSEALTNAAKHAGASVVHVAVRAREQTLSVSVRDDGVGGADPHGGSGLLGLKDRAEAIGGTLSLQSVRGVGTALDVELPLDAR